MALLGLKYRIFFIDKDRNQITHLVAFVLDHLAKRGAKIFSFGGPICVTNLLVYTSFHTHAQTHTSIHTQKLVSFTMKSLKIKCCIELNLSFIFFYNENSFCHDGYTCSLLVSSSQQVQFIGRTKLKLCP